MPRVYAYLRVSHNDSAASGLSIETQEKLFKDWYEYEKGAGRLPDHELGTVGWMGGPDVDENGLVRRDNLGQYKRIDIDRTDGVYVDLAKSAFKHKFLTRDAAIRMNIVLKPGDKVWFSKLDRSFRNTGDACAILEQWQRRNISMVFHQQNIDTGTAAGRAFYQMLALIAEFDSSLKSERIKEILAHQIALGRPVGGNRRFGYRCTSEKNWVPDWDERRIIQGIINARHSLPYPKVLSWSKVSDAIEKQLATQEGRKVRTANSTPPRQWDFRTCESAYKQALRGGWAELPPGAKPVVRIRRSNRDQKSA